MRVGKLVGVTFAVTGLMIGMAVAAADHGAHKKSAVHVRAPYTKADVDEPV